MMRYLMIKRLYVELHKVKKAENTEPFFFCKAVTNLQYKSSYNTDATVRDISLLVNRA